MDCLTGATRVCTKCGTRKPVVEYGRREQGNPYPQRQCKECIAERRREWHQRTRDKRRAYDKQYDDGFRAQALELLGGCCLRCGFDDPRALQIDHVNGGGSQEFKALGGKHLSRLVVQGKRSTDDLQLLCANCNWIKRYENNEHNSRAA